MSHSLQVEEILTTWKDIQDNYSDILGKLINELECNQKDRNCQRLIMELKGVGHISTNDKLGKTMSHNFLSSVALIIIL